MSKVIFRPFYSLRALLGESEMEMHVVNVRDILNNLEVKFGNDLREIIYDKKGRFRDYTYLYVNNRLKSHPEDLATPLSDGDIVVLIPPITPNG